MTRHRVDICRQGLREGGFNETQIAELVGKIWVWRSIDIAERDGDAQTQGRAAFTQMLERRHAMRHRVAQERGVMLSPQVNSSPAGFICGSPDKVAEELAELADIGIAGALMQFRLGAMSHEAAAHNIEFFMRAVAPGSRREKAA